MKALPMRLEFREPASIPSISIWELQKIKHYTVRHEEAAIHAADGYFRASGKMAVAICTSGPGATNFVTGIYTANADSIPLIAITGQSVTSSLGKDAFQCVNIAEICKPVAKSCMVRNQSRRCAGNIAPGIQNGTRGEARSCAYRFAA